MDSVFFQSVLVQPPVILGLQLRHFSCYHALVLLQFDNPFLAGGACNMDDIIFAVWTCTQEFETGPADLISDQTMIDACTWGKQIKEFEPAQARKDIEIYLQNYLDFPKFWSPEKSKGKMSNIPWPFKLAATVLNNYSQFTEAEVWNMAINKAAAYRAHVAEENGNDLANEAILQQLKQCNESR